ncbi:MAG: single-stranded-DNA-specific exonuclease RecJ [Cyanobacterium sp. T60_A2020_053]|nr:single-stranded-DNA-specific exonuclease RecJ [Cyanobacterium sp. T60_A2020_053]
MNHQWQTAPSYPLSEDFLQLITTHVKNHKLTTEGKYLAQILWHRGIRDEKSVNEFLDSRYYQPSSPLDFGQEMKMAVKRLALAMEEGEKICIWGDFDADGVTSTAVLWEGLGQFFTPESQLTYYIPNRLRESHGLNRDGIKRLSQQGVTLIVTCDTGSTNLDEIAYATELGIDIIVTDHHTLPEKRPPLVAIINPRYFADNHPLYTLSGVAVAYKLVEAMYQCFPRLPRQPLTSLLDLVVIGLIADLVELKGDCRYLALEGMKILPHTKRVGVQKLLDLAKKNGDRPMDISFGIAPRINAVSRILGDASFCVKLLTTNDRKEAEILASQAEEANFNRKEVQKKVLDEAKKQVKDLDLSTTAVIVLSDNQWQTGVLGLVANALSQEYGRPSILFNTMNDNNDNLARGSARSVNGINLYDLVASQRHLLTHFGGHPFAAGMALPIENIELFREGINQKLKQQLDITNLEPIINIDLTVTVAELGKNLFRELYLIEPCGMGNPAPIYLVKNCCFKYTFSDNIKNKKDKKIKYLLTTYTLYDDSQRWGIKGKWWGHSSSEIDENQRYDVVVSLDCKYEENKHKKDKNPYTDYYEVTLIDLKLAENNTVNFTTQNKEKSIIKQQINSPVNIHTTQIKSNIYQEKWSKLMGVVKYAINHQKYIDKNKLKEKLLLTDKSLLVGLRALEYLGFDHEEYQQELKFSVNKSKYNELEYQRVIKQFIKITKDEYIQSLFTAKNC